MVRIAAIFVVAVAVAVVVVTTACRPYPVIGGLGRCSLRGSAATAEASDACHRTEIADASQMPAELAAAGCTGLASYQRGLGHKSVRYAICPPAPAACLCSVPRGTRACTTPLGRFLSCYAAGDLGESGPPAQYGWAHVVTEVCDACLGNIPAGKILVVWHERATCPDDSKLHDDAIRAAFPNPESRVPPPPPPPQPSLGGAGGPAPCSTCRGGCMAPEPPNL